MKTKFLWLLAIITILFPTICMAEDAMVQVKGSDTLINVVQKLAETYMEKSPNKAISVTGGGSGTGIAALVNRKCDIANSSRGMKPKEIEDANSKGVDPKRIVIAIDGLSIIVNGNNPVKKLTIDQIGKMYRGELTNWKDVGGNDTPVNLYGRQSNSGTYEFLKDLIKGEYASSMKSMNGNAQIVESVKQDAGGIGYVGVGYAKEATGIIVLSVSSNTVLGYFSPLNSDDVKSGRYPITRPLNQYVNGSPKGDVKEFIQFELSAQGQKTVESEGFFSVPEEYVRYNNETLGL
jgi:phosphate transport system substrate-binding protein